MPAYRAEVLVLRQTKLGETDSILTLLSRDGSQIRAVAKGLRKSGSRFGARLEPYSVVELLLNAGRSLDNVTDVKVIEGNAACRVDLEHSAAAAVVASALARSSQEGQGERMVFDLACAALEAIGQARVDVLPLLVAAFLIKLLAIHGYRPTTGECPVCGRDSSTGTALSCEAGGFLCEDCSEGATAIAVSPTLQGWVAYALSVRFSEVLVSDHPPQVGIDLLHFSRLWIEQHLGGRIKALEFFLTVLPSEPHQ